MCLLDHWSTRWCGVRKGAYWIIGVRGGVGCGKVLTGSLEYAVVWGAEKKCAYWIIGVRGGVGCGKIPVLTGSLE